MFQTVFKQYCVSYNFILFYLQKLEQDDDDQYLNSSWSDSCSLKRQVHGLDDVKFKFTK